MNRILTAAALLALAPSAWAQDWDKIGSRVVEFGGDKDTISGAGDGRFNAIKIEVDDGELAMWNIKVTFANGEHFSPETRLEFDQNSKSRTIDLPGEARAIKTVEFWYKSRLKKGRATVTVWGRRAGGAAPKDPPKDPPKDDWEKIGSRVVDFGGDKDTISGAGDGRFNAIKIEVEDGEIQMWNIKVTFGNGDPFSPDTKIDFDQNSKSRTIDLPGEARAIRTVEFWYKSKLRRGKATVTVWGRKAGGAPDKPAEKWEKLGSRQVQFDGEKDTIVVGAVEGRFNAIKIDVDEGNVEMYNIKVTFGDDSHWSPDTKIEFKQGMRSRTIDLPGEARVIRKVEFWYRSELKRGRANVDLFGRHAGGGAPDKPALKDPKDRHPGWEHIGTRQVDFGADKDVIDCRGEGRFSAFKVEVDDADLEMYDIVVTFGNGDTVSPKTRLEFDENTRSRDIDFPGKARVVTKIAFFYKSKRGGRDGRATIHVYGKK